jgi:hypothetical protein
MILSSADSISSDERTFLCSMTPTRWPEYVNRVADLLSIEGKLIWHLLVWTTVDVRTAVSPHRDKR